MDAGTISKLLTGLDGGMGLIGTAVKSGQGADISQYNQQLDQIGAGRTQNVFDNTQLLQYQQNMNQRSFNVTADKLNPSVGESVGNIASSTLSGAMTGLSVGGPWGALAGAVVGLGSSLGADLYGRAGNQYKADILNQQQETEKSLNRLALNTNIDQAHEYQFNQAWSQRKAAGGKIEKKQMSLQDFADGVMKRQKFNDRTHSSGIIRRHGDGGTIIRIKR